MYLIYSHLFVYCLLRVAIAIPAAVRYGNVTSGSSFSSPDPSNPSVFFLSSSPLLSSSTLSLFLSTLRPSFLLHSSLFPVHSFTSFVYCPSDSRDFSVLSFFQPGAVSSLQGSIHLDLSPLSRLSLFTFFSVLSNIPTFAIGCLVGLRYDASDFRFCARGCLLRHPRPRWPPHCNCRHIGPALLTHCQCRILI
jgi:hypothetical protein